MGSKFCKQIYTLLLLTFSFLGNAQVIFQERIAYSNPGIVDGPRNFLIADLNNDGFDDIIIGSERDNQIAWYQNLDGQGNYSDMQLISSTTQEVLSIHEGDIDNDGDIDIVCYHRTKSPTNFVAYEIVLFENINGTGNFKSSEPLFQISQIRPVHLVDYDEDGDLDIISANFESDFGWWENENNGQFQNFTSFEEQYNFPTYTGNIGFEDIDGDGDLDVVTSFFTESHWYENIDNSTEYSEAKLIGQHTHISYFKFGDMDGDGDLDMVGASVIGSTNMDNQILWIENLGGGVFGTEKFVDELGPDIESFGLADLNGDNQLDVITGMGDINSVSWYQNLGGGNFASKVLIMTVLNVSEVITIDYDNDGDLDIISASNFDNYMMKHINLDGDASNWESSAISNFKKRISAMMVADLDGDGDKDIVSAFRTGFTLGWQENLGNGTYASYDQFKNLQWPIKEMTSFDADSDGDIDIIYCMNAFSGSNNTYDALWLENLGDSNWGESHFMAGGIKTVSKLMGADIDNDSDIDLFVSDVQSYAIKWFENTDGLGSYGPENEVVSFPSTVYDFEAADFNGDSTLDIIMLDSRDGLPYLIPNTDGVGTFGEKIQIGNFESNLRNIAVADLHSDGDPDIVLSGGAKVIVYENTDSNGSYSRLTEKIKILSDYAEFADIDLDGDLDIPFTTTSHDSLHWYENINGSDEFVLHSLEYQTINPQTLIVEDMNQDGALDLVTYTTNDKIYIFENQGLSGNRITGQVFYDDSNNQCADGHYSIGGVIVTALGVNGAQSSLSSLDEYFQLNGEIGEYKTTVDSYIPNIVSISPSEHYTNFTDIGSIDTVQFCLTPETGINNLSLTILPLDDIRPGFNVRYQAILKNLGTTTASGNLDINYDESVLSFVEATPSTSQLELGRLQFSFSDLKPFNELIYNIEYVTALIPDVQLEQIVETHASIDGFPDDIQPSDNVFSLGQTIIGSYDPNDIRVLEGRQVHIDDADEYLHYIIRFQNTGNASAINVRVENSLDDHLDWRSFELLSTSHEVEVVITDSVDIAFYFDNINLPDSLSNPINSQGYICYRILPIEEVEIGDDVDNIAGIFFDFNPPIITNMVNTEFVDVVNVDDESLANISIYPIPTTGFLYLSEQVDQLTIYDAHGKWLSSSEKIEFVDLSQFEDGIYFMVVQKNGNESSKKVVLMK